jgi:hypothetical protein
MKFGRVVREIVWCGAAVVLSAMPSLADQMPQGSAVTAKATAQPGMADISPP